MKIDCNLIVDVLDGFIQKSRRIKIHKNRISSRYSELKMTMSFCEAARQAKIEWLQKYLEKK